MKALKISLLKLWWVIALFVMLFGCKKPASVSDIKESKDSIVYKEKVRIDTVLVPGEMVPFEIPCPDKKNASVNKPFTFTNKKASVRATVGSDNIVRGVADCPDLRALIAEKNTEIERYKSQKEVQIKVQQVYKTHWYDKVCHWITLIVLVYIIYRIAKITPWGKFITILKKL